MLIWAPLSSHLYSGFKLMHLSMARITKIVGDLESCSSKKDLNGYYMILPRVHPNEMEMCIVSLIPHNKSEIHAQA